MKPSYKILNCLFLVGAWFGLGASLTRSTGLSEILTQSAWVSYEYWTDVDGDGIFVQSTESCESDNQWALSSDQTFLILENEQVCPTDQPELDTISGFWNIDAQESIVRLALPVGATELYFKVYSIGQDEIILSAIDPDDIEAEARERIVLRR